MIEKSFIHKSVAVRSNSIFVDGKACFSGDGLPFADFAKVAFRELNAAYPKFYKMDALSKLTLLAAEYLLEGEDTEGLALVLANRSGSLDTDIRHQESIQDEANFFPSPATFVYTLANICAGELSIRHTLQTENAFFVAEQYPAKTISAYADYLLLSHKAKRVLCGWVEFFQGNYEAVLYIVSSTGEMTHTVPNIEILFAEQA